jgi:YaiO family outer membrane protein
MGAGPRKPPFRIVCLSSILMALLFPLVAHAQPNVTSPTPIQPTTEASDDDRSSQSPPTGEIEVNGGYSSDEFTNWSGPSVHGSFEPRNSFNRWSAGVARLGAFGTSSEVFEGGLDRDLTNVWDVGLSITGATGLFMPRLSADVFASKRWSSNAKLITTLNGSYVRWQDVHRDYRWGLDVSYRFERPWSVNAGINVDLSTPTNQWTEDQYVSVTQGRAKKYLITLRSDFGRAAYQVIGPTTSISNFQSYGVSSQLRQWVGGHGWGFIVSGGYTTNPFYRSKGFTMGLFKEFAGGSRDPAKHAPVS